ncbi:putative aconitase [Mesorhizobium robiniae]|uniref:Aconitase n=1 Tax=Mesorhizobium robiniae TaxID=559315 RepID=A0ABV2GHC4_9HYPH
MTLELGTGDQSMLDGEHGPAVAAAMKILIAFSKAVGARELLDIAGAHIDGCLYHGQASLDFVERLVEGGGQVRVPTTLNVGSFDLIPDW